MTSKFSRYSPSEQELTEALAICLDAMLIGSDLETCLEMYPALADDLRPLLLASQSAQALTTIRVPTEAMNRSRTRMLGRAAEIRETRKTPARRWVWPFRVPRLAFSALSALVIILAVGYTVNATATRALPGETLYPLKLSVENFWMGVTPGSQAKDALEQVFRERRLDEVRELLALGREETVTFQGVLAGKESLSGIAPERWLVSDIYVLRSIDTEVIGEIEIGMFIEVSGHTRSDGFVEAYTFRPLAFSFIGDVEEITTDIWTVGGRLVRIRQGETTFDPGIGVGAQVMVLAEFDQEANIFARAILLTGSAEPIPTASATPTSEPTLIETAITSVTPDLTPSPTQTVTVSPTVSPTPSPSVTPSPEGDGTSEVETEEPEDSETPEIETSETVEPEDTDEPDKTDEPTKTKEPTKTDEPDDDSSNSGSGSGNSGSGGGGGDDD